jgi:predicted porin
MCGHASVQGAIPDGPITWMGVTFYGTVDVGYAYIHNGSHPSGAQYYGAGYTIFSSPYNHGEVSTLNNNGLQLSNVGLMIEEQLGGSFTAIGKLETQFNPISGELGDACASLLRFSGTSLFNQEKNNDGSRCGQAFANAAYGGVSNPIYGTLTAGRQGSLVNDGMGTYDPIAGAPAFSLLGYSSTAVPAWAAGKRPLGIIRSNISPLACTPMAAGYADGERRLWRRRRCRLYGLLRRRVLHQGKRHR